MAAVLLEPFDGQGAWTGREMRGRTDWACPLSAAEIAELDTALAEARRRGARPFTMTREDFPLGSLAETFVALRRTIDEGRGFHLLRGIPVGRYSEEECRLLAWGLATHLGEPEPQDGQGSLMHDIRDTGRRIETTDDVRGFQTNTELHFHNDGGDAFMLLCLRTARHGGMSKLVSVAALFNAILARRPDLAAVLQRPFHFDARGQQAAGRPRVQSVPILCHHLGRMHAIYKRFYIELGQRFPEVPRLTPHQIEALDMVDALCNDPELHLSFQMRPGDLQIGSNHAVLHSRTQYVDHDDPALKRHLLRVWLTLPNGRPLPPDYAETREFCHTYARRRACAAAPAA